MLSTRQLAVGGFSSDADTDADAQRQMLDQILCMLHVQNTRFVIWSVAPPQLFTQTADLQQWSLQSLV
jgi:hypothetical protein